MPLIDIHVLEGVFDEDEKARMISACARAFGSVAGPAMERNTSVRVREVPSGAWGGSTDVWTTEKALGLKASD